MGHNETSFPMFVHFCVSVHCCTTLSPEICSSLAQVTVIFRLTCALLINVTFIFHGPFSLLWADNIKSCSDYSIMFFKGMQTMFFITFTHFLL